MSKTMGVEVATDGMLTSAQWRCKAWFSPEFMYCRTRNR